MSTIQDVTFTTGVSGGGTPNNLPVNMPATVVANDFLLMGVWNANITPPTGWTLRDSSNNTSDRMRLYSKTAAGTEGGTVVNCTERAGTVAGLNFLAAVVRLQFSAAAVALPYTVSYSGGQFGQAGSNPYTEEIGPFSDLGTTYATGVAFKYIRDAIVAGTSPTYVSDSAHITDHGSLDHLTSTTAANSATNHGRLLVVSYDDLTGDYSAIPGTITITARNDTLLNGVGAFLSASIPLGVVVVPAETYDTVSGGLLFKRRRTTARNLPYQVNTSRIRRA